MSWFIFTVKNTSKGKIAEWHGLQGWGEISDEHGNRFKPVSPDGWQSLNGVPGLLDGVRVGDDSGKIKINPGVTYQNSVYFEPCLPSSKIAILSIQIGERTLLFRGAFQQADQRVKEAEAKAKKEREEAQRKKEEEQRAKDAEAAKKEREDEERRIEAERQMKKEAEAKDRKEREDKAGYTLKDLKEKYDPKKATYEEMRKRSEELKVIAKMYPETESGKATCGSGRVGTEGQRRQAANRSNQIADKTKQEGRGSCQSQGIDRKIPKYALR